MWLWRVDLYDDVFASLCTSDHLSEGGDTGHTERKAHHDQHEDGEPELTEHTQTFHSLVTDLCFNVTSTGKAEELACKKFEMNISPSNMENRKWAEETEAHPCGHSSNHHHPFPNRLHQESFYSHRWNYFLNKMWFMLMFQNISKN